jgi:hypothetical protein
MLGPDDRSTSLLSYLSSVFGGVVAYLRLDRVESGNTGQQFGRQRRLCRCMELEEVAPHVRPTKCQPHRAVGTIRSQPLELGIAVDLQHAIEAG